MNQHTGWDFTDDRDRPVRARSRPTRFAAYIQAGATLWDHGLRPVGIFGSFHDGDAPDPAKAGELPLAALHDFGAGGALDLDALLAAEPELVVAVGYGTGQVYGIDPDTAKRLEEHVPVVVLDVGNDRPLAAIRDRFTELARSLGAPRPPAAEDLDRAESALRGLTARPDNPRVLALSAAGPETAYLARPLTWPGLRALTELGVGLLEPGAGSGVNWRTADWSEAAALEPDIVLADVRVNATPPGRLRDNPHWRELEERARILPWNPEAPCSHRAQARFLDTVAAAL